MKYKHLGNHYRTLYLKILIINKKKTVLVESFGRPCKAGGQSTRKQYLKTDFTTMPLWIFHFEKGLNWCFRLITGFYPTGKKWTCWLTFHVWSASLQQDQVNLLLTTGNFLNLKLANCVGKTFNTKGDFSDINEAKPPVYFPINLH